jgi:glyoxylase-like metal-dependent hydrolase (beta-lactamase superfamily II)
MNKRLTRYFYALLAVLTVVVISASAQAPDISKAPLKTTKLAANFYTIEGPGGTIGFLTGPEGTLMVDGQFAPLSERIMGEIKAVSNAPVKILINTHVHGDHTGGNANFAKMGAIIFAREELRNRLAHPNPSANGTPGTPAPEAALPVVTYSSPLTFHMNGEDVHAIPVPVAHTDGDTIVHFVKSDVIMTGDFYRSVGYPNIDRNNGGSLKGLLEGLDVVIKLAGPNTKIIPGHMELGKPVDKAAVQAHRTMIVAVRDRVAKLIQEGKSEADIKAAKPLAEYDAKIPQAQQTTERFLTQLYAELKNTR